jgi:hypothetical protein
MARNSAMNARKEKRFLWHKRYIRPSVVGDGSMAHVDDCVCRWNVTMLAWAFLWTTVNAGRAHAQALTINITEAGRGTAPMSNR